MDENSKLPPLDSTPPPDPTPQLNPDLPTLWIIGDSTVRTGTPGQQGWGDPIAACFDTTRINVINRARGGRSSRTFQTHGLWEDVLRYAKPGDFVIMQFGHNDESPVNDDSRARGTLPGIGDETETIDNMLTGERETVHTFGWYMRQYITEARAARLTPIICAAIPRLPKDTVTLPLPQTTGHRLWSQQVAEAENVCFIDLNSLILTSYEGMTPDEIRAAFFTEQDGTHTSPAGAAHHAALVIKGLRELPDCPLNHYVIRPMTKAF